MAARQTADPDLDAALLSQILKAIRRRRGLKVAQVAKAMRIATRTYANFEAGRQRISIAGASQRTLMVDAPNTVTVAAGERVGLTVPPDAIRLLPAED